MNTEIDHLEIDVNYRFPKKEEGERFESLLVHMVSNAVQRIASSMAQTALFEQGSKRVGLPTHIDIEHIDIRLPQVDAKAFLYRPEHYFSAHLLPVIERQLAHSMTQVIASSDKLFEAGKASAQQWVAWAEMLKTPALFKHVARQIRSHAFAKETQQSVDKLFPPIMVKSLMVAAKEADAYADIVWHFAQRLLAKQGRQFEEAVWQRIMALVLKIKQSHVQVSGSQWEVLFEALTTKGSSLLQEQLDHWAMHYASKSAAHTLTQKGLDELVHIADKARLSQFPYHSVKEGVTGFVDVFGANMNLPASKQYTPALLGENDNSPDFSEETRRWIQSLNAKLAFLGRLKKYLAVLKGWQNRPVQHRLVANNAKALGVAESQKDEMDFAALAQCIFDILEADLSLPDATELSLHLIGLRPQNRWKATTVALSVLAQCEASVAKRQAIDWQGLESALRLTSLPMRCIQAISALLAQKEGYQLQQALPDTKRDKVFWRALSAQICGAITALKKHYAQESSLLSPPGNSGFWGPLQRALFSYRVVHSEAACLQQNKQAGNLTVEQERLSVELSQCLIQNIHRFSLPLRETALGWLRAPLSQTAFSHLVNGLVAEGVVTSGELEKAASESVVTDTNKIEHDKSAVTEPHAKQVLAQMHEQLKRWFSFTGQGPLQQVSLVEQTEPLLIMQALMAYESGLNQLAQTCYQAYWCDAKALTRLNFANHFQILKRCVLALHESLPTATQQGLSVQTWWAQLGSAMEPVLDVEDEGIATASIGASVSKGAGKHSPSLPQNDLGRDRIFQQRYQALLHQAQHVLRSLQKFNDANSEKYSREYRSESLVAQSEIQSVLGLCEEALFIAKSLRASDTSNHRLSWQDLKQNSVLRVFKGLQTLLENRSERMGGNDRRIFSLIGQITVEKAQSKPTSREVQLLQSLLLLLREKAVNWRSADGADTNNDLLKTSSKAMHAEVTNCLSHIQSLSAANANQLALGVAVRDVARLYVKWGEASSLFKALGPVLNAWEKSFSASEQESTKAHRQKQASVTTSLRILQDIKALISRYGLDKPQSKGAGVRQTQVQLARLSDAFLQHLVSLNQWDAFSYFAEHHGSELPQNIQVPQALSYAKHSMVEALVSVDVESIEHPIQRALNNALSVFEEEQTHAVMDVGLAIFWPFLSTLFARLGLLDEAKSWKSDQAQSKAMALLMYLFCGDEKGPDNSDNEGVFIPICANLLLGLDAMTPLQANEALSDDDKAECDNLQTNLIKQWEALKGMGISSFNRMFVQREGTLEEVDFGFAITVKKQAQDILLAKLPWGLGIIRLPWLDGVMLDIRWQSGL